MSDTERIERLETIVRSLNQQLTELRAEVESRLRRIGIRWGLVPGPRVTQEFHAPIGPAALRRVPPKSGNTD